MSGVGDRRPAAGKDDAAACEAVPHPATAAAPALLVLRPAEQPLRPSVSPAA